ncbi:substrate-binding domain-containing protein [Allonocardiopsis opalescens]|uniref:von Willebrand factor type A domain-containing protein n=1 Tax=Allonocardiopsis opalescens TaxID=1144618 RepID=A0A2T0PVV4_9ACTN|nr:substrate-binding domain-containing protein [Allonocardiopsis opalescens]PRX95488.1 von Willebrand factor type A domain-containing protein [Allonocardiopsis opalescens]
MGRHDSSDDYGRRDGSPNRRRRRRRGGAAVGLLVLAAVIVLALGAGGWVLLSGGEGCRGAAIPVQVAASPDIAPALTSAATAFNSEQHRIDGQCVEASVRPVDSATVAYSVTGSGPTLGDLDPDVWVPDSSLWAEYASSAAASDQPVSLTGTSLASTPLVLASASADDELFAEPSWELLLLDPTAPAPPYSVQLLEPTRYSAGVATLTMIRRGIGDTPDADSRLTAAIRSLQQSVAANEEAARGLLSAEDGDTLMVLPEQLVWQHNQDAERTARALYPREGTVLLDYPYTVVTDDSVRQRAAEEFRRSLAAGAADRHIQADGFRRPDGSAGSALAEAEGFRAEPPEQLPAPGSDTFGEVTQAWNRLKLGTRMLTLIDVSGSMLETIPGSEITRIQATVAAAQEGLELFPDDSEIGTWTFSVRLNNQLDYQEISPLVPLSQQTEGGGTARDELLAALNSIQVDPDGDTGLYDSILAGFREVSRGYQPDKINTVLIFTDGVNEDDDSISLEDLVATLENEFDPERPVSIIAIAFGPDTDAAPLREITTATNGATYTTEDPSEIGAIFLDSIALRICAPNCTPRDGD